MSQLEETDDFYAAGRRLAEHIANSKGKEVSTATLQALIRDFLTQHEEVQEALRSIVARPDFLQLVKLAGSDNGVSKKSEFIESLERIYSAESVKAADNLVCGLMGLGVTTAHDDSEVQKTTVDTLYHERKKSYPKDANSSEKSYVRGKGREAGENLSQAPQSHSLRNLSLSLWEWLWG